MGYALYMGKTKGEREMAKRTEQITVTIEAPSGINSQTGKVEEMEILAAITNRVRGTQTYLDSLFTDELADYFNGQVKNDFCPNIMAEYYAQIETNRNQAGELARANMKIDCLEHDVERYKEAYRVSLTNRQDMIDRLSDTVNVLRVAMSNERQEFMTLKQDRDNMAEQVDKLKIKLFDLMNKDAA